MKRHELEHVLRAASRIAEPSDVLVIGSQSILGSIDDSDLPPWGAIQLHETFGYCAQGVSITTAIFPTGWVWNSWAVAQPVLRPGPG